MRHEAFLRRPTVRRLAGTAAGLAVLAVAGLATAPARAQMTEFTCSGDQLGEAVPGGATLRRVAAWPRSTLYGTNVQMQPYGNRGAPRPTQIGCSVDFDPSHGDGAGPPQPIDGAYRLVLTCTAKPTGISSALDRARLSVPAPAQGGPFDDPSVKARFTATACLTLNRALQMAALSAVR